MSNTGTTGKLGSYSRHQTEHREHDAGVHDPGFVWEEKVRTLKEIITNGKYPCVVKVTTGNVSRYDRTEGRTSSEGKHEDNVLHVLEPRRRKVVVATKMHWERRTGDYSPTDKQVEIDVAQKGWFEVLPENGQPVEYFDTINAIVSIRPKQFLVRTSIVGYQLTVENGASCWAPWEIRPGEILTAGIVHMDQKKAKKKTLFKRLFSGSKGAGKKEQELKYLQCFDNENREIMVPVIMTGVFSPVGESTCSNYDAVYNLHDLINAFSLPIKAQLIHTEVQSYENIPSGVMRFEHLKDSESALVARHPHDDNDASTFEIPLKDDVQVVRDKKKKSKRNTLVSNDDVDNTVNEKDDQYLDESPVSLPVRVKDTKRSRGTAILEKLSVRSKAKKERASLKVLQEQGIFSSRLSKNELTFEDAAVESNDSELDNTSNSKHDIVTPDSRAKSKLEEDLENEYSVSAKLSAMQDRDLPPIPIKTRSPRHRDRPHKENVYEELPLAPRPPNGSAGYHYHIDSNGQVDPTDDGYMTPARFRELNESDENGRGEFDLIVKRKPPTAPRDSLRYTRARKVKSEFSPLDFEEDADAEIDQMFDFTYTTDGGTPINENPYERRRQIGQYSQVQALRGFSVDESQVRQRLFYDDSRRFHDDSAIENRTLSGAAKLKSRSHKNLNFESNATIRSHNVRKMRTAMEVFNFSDSLRDLRKPFQNGGDEPNYGRVVDSERVQSYIDNGATFSRVGNSRYVESEPAYRKYHRSSSAAGLNEVFSKHGDDSAISLCSRGEYGAYPNESEYSYSEYSEWHDDGFVPPDDISSLSVLEVSKSLRYIGMKDRVVIRFSREQIDGNMLYSLDKKLLKEGFPELNALDIKKIVDFISGWRPKK